MTTTKNESADREGSAGAQHYWEHNVKVQGTTNAGPAEGVAPTIAIVEYWAHGPLAKRVWAERDGGTLVIRKDVPGLRANRFEVHALSVEGWEHAYTSLVSELTVHSYLCHAAMRDGVATEGAVLSKGRLTKVECERPEIADRFTSRSRDFLHYPAGPGIMLIDSDEAVTPAELDTRISAVLPDFSKVGRVSYASSGSCIYTDAGGVLRGISGLHTAVAVADASDIPRAGEALAVRLALAGDYHVFISQSGVLYLRTFVDTQMFNPAQPEFASGCYLDNEKSAVPLEQRRPEPTQHSGVLLDTRANIPPLTGEERARYAALVAAEKKQHSREIAQRRGETVKRTEMALIANGVKSERANRLARATVDDLRLVPPCTVLLNDRTPVPVADLLADPHAWMDRGWAFRDPLEPDYGEGKARVFADSAGVSLRSYAHGGRSFRLGFDAMSAIEMLDRSGREDLIDYFFSELRQYFTGDAADMDSVLRHVKRKTGTGLGALRDLEKAWTAKRNAGASESNILDAEDIEIAERVRSEVYGGADRLTFADDHTFKAFQGTHWGTVQTHHLAAEAHRIAVARREDLTLQAKSQGRAAPAWGQTVTVASKIAVDALERMATQRIDFTRKSGEWPAILNFRNGTLDLESMRLRRHDPKDGLLYCSPMEYDPGAVSPAWDEMLRLIWPGMPEVWRHFEEVLGYAIQPARFMKLIVVAWGSGYNGKSPLLFTLPRAILGVGAVGPMTLSLMDDDKFSTSDPVGKLILVEDDLKAGALWPDSALKKLSERTLLRAEAKHVQAFHFMNNCVPIVLGNFVPSIRDTSIATADRIQAFHMEQSFRPGGVTPYNRATADRIFGRILGPELPGVVNRLIAGYRRVQARPGRGGLEPPARCLQWRKAYLQQGNQVLLFVDERCDRVAPDKGRPAVDLFQAYESWHFASGRKGDTSLGRNSFYDRLREAGYVIRPGHADEMKAFGLSLKAANEPFKDDPVFG